MKRSARCSITIHVNGAAAAKSLANAIRRHSKASKGKSAKSHKTKGVVVKGQRVYGAAAEAVKRARARKGK